jgi:hypothetical protein
MPISTIYPKTFPHSKPYSGSATNLRPFADVVLIGPTGSSYTIQCLVDTGSDHTILPLGLATSVGIIPSGPLVSVAAAGGTRVSFQSHAPADLVIEGYTIRGVTILLSPFSAIGGFTPILGRKHLINAFDFGFDTKEWHWG